MAKAKNEIEFTGVHQVRFEFVGKPKRGPGGPSVRAYFEGAWLEGAWLEPIRDAMGWSQIDPETVRGTPGLRGALIGCQVILTPSAGELSQHEITLRAQRIGNFEVFMPEQTTKKDKPPVLRFRLESSDDGLETKLGLWGRILGDAKARLKVNYGELKKTAKHDKSDDDDDAQEELPLTGEAKAEHDQRVAGRKATVSIRKVKR
jgi:hypothetical protein